MAYCYEYVRRLCKIGFLVAIIIYPSVSDPKPHARRCSPGLTTTGYTVPNGDILIEYGDPLDILCVLYDDYVEKHGPNASAHITFERNNDTLPREMIEIVNTSTVRLHIEKPPKSVSMYTCGIDAKAVCLNNVYVGTKPQDVTDFECISYNYDNLTCTWTAPQNYVKTDYELKYSLRGRASRKMMYGCAKMTYPEGDYGKMSCFWNVKTSPQYRHVQEQFLFYLTMNNTFGVNKLETTFNHFQHVLPEPPENLTAVNATSSSIYLHWTVPVSMQNFPRPLEHRVMYCCQYTPKVFQFGGIIERRDAKNVFYNLTNLPYAHNLCDIRVSSRSAVALKTDEKMWSRNASITVRTSSEVPGAPPQTNIGSFELVECADTRYVDAYVYWQQIPEKIKNGPNFNYTITIEGDSSFMPSELTNAYAKFKCLSKSRSYRFIIRSQNDVGISAEKSVVYIPKHADRVKEPAAFTKIAFGDGNYELTWEKPRDITGIVITNYTLFWCEHNKDRPYQCTGQLDWIELPGTTTVHNITVDEPVNDTKVYQFAVAANTPRGSSGMIWAACTVIHNQRAERLKSVWINGIGSTFIEVGWKAGCYEHSGSIVAYIIYYCPIISPTQTDCKGPQRNVTITGDATMLRGTVSGLTPYTTYMLRVATRGKDGSENPPSDPLYNTTLEAAPSSPPLNVQVIEVTNSSVTVTWDHPGITNGVLKYYEVRCDHISHRVEPKAETKYTFTNMSSYEECDISIVACTISCSQPSKPIPIRTKMGYPSKISQPTVTFQNGTYIVVSWDAPIRPGGRVAYYEVLIKEKIQNENKTNPTFNVTNTFYNIENCGDEQKSFFFSVRAVNRDEAGKILKGPWSEELESYCRSPPTEWIYVLILPIIVSVFGVIWTVKKLYFKYKNMEDIRPVLPTGLDPTPNKPKVPEPDRHSADEQLLLDKINSGTRQRSGDSSGCSSGHESVASSDTSSHISGSSDSGTEQPRSPSGELRQRTVGTPRLAVKDYILMPLETTTPSWGNKSPPPPGSYSVLGVDPTNSNAGAASQDIVKIPCEFAPSSTPYVQTGVVMKTPNPGYVPFSSVEPVEKNPEYVVPGNKSMMPDLLQRETGKNAMPAYVQVSEKPTDRSSWTPTAGDASVSTIGYVKLSKKTK